MKTPKPDKKVKLTGILHHSRADFIIKDGKFVNPINKKNTLKSWEDRLYMLYTKDTDDWNYWKKWVGRIIKSALKSKAKTFEEMISSSRMPSDGDSIKISGTQWFLIREKLKKLI